MRLYQHVNSLIAVALVVLGWAAMRWPDRIGDRGAAATLAGALFGAAALFVGSEINQWGQRLSAKDELEERQKKIRQALGPEFARVCINIGGFARGLADHNQFMAKLSDNGDEDGSGRAAASREFDLLRFIPPQAPVFETLKTELLVLPEREVDAIMRFYGNLESLRLHIRMTSDWLTSSAADWNLWVRQNGSIVLRMQSHLEAALALTSLCWPQLHVDMGKKSESLLLNVLQTDVRYLKRLGRRNSGQ